jgi:hypothetical protein
MPDFIELVLHLDKHLAEFVSQYGAWIYAIPFRTVPATIPAKRSSSSLPPTPSG